MSTNTNNGAVIIQADKERFLKLGIKQIRFLESERGLNKSLIQVFQNEMSYSTLFTLFSTALVGASKMEESDIEEIMDETVANLEGGLPDLIEIISKASGGYMGKIEEDSDDSEELQPLP